MLGQGVDAYCLAGERADRVGAGVWLRAGGGGGGGVDGEQAQASQIVHRVVDLVAGCGLGGVRGEWAMAADITAEMFLKAFNSVGGDSSAAARAVTNYKTLSGWRASQIAQAAAAGAAAMAIPVAHIATLAADFAVLLRKMAVCAWGIGYKLGAVVEAEEDLAIILGLWSGAVERDALSVTAAASGGAAGMIALNAAYPTFAQAVMTQVLTQGGHTVVTAVAGKVAGKGGGKMAAKLTKPLLQMKRARDSAEVLADARLEGGHGHRAVPRSGGRGRDQRPLRQQVRRRRRDVLPGQARIPRRAGRGRSRPGVDGVLPPARAWRRKGAPHP